MSKHDGLKEKKNDLELEEGAEGRVQVEKKKDKKKKDESKKKHSEEVAGDVDGEPSEKKDKKKKKKSENSAKETGEDAMDVDTLPSKTKKKKRKREEDEASAPAESKKDKKKRKKEEKEKQQSSILASEPDSKKDKKKHKKEEKAAAYLPTPGPSKPSSPKPALSSSNVSSFLESNSITISVPAGASAVTPILSFDQLPIAQELRKSFSGFKEPTPIQACTWPPALDGRDVVGIAETGSGKTLGFGIPALSRLISSSAVSASGITTLVVAPTRELALQTHDTLSELGKLFGIGSVAVFGGVSKEPQIKLLRSVVNNKKGGVTTKIVVGTPGRILDLVNDGACDLSGVDYLVLDEADRMLDKGFENDIRRIIGFCKQKSERQTMMFSATWPDAVRRLAASFQQDPVRVTVGSDDLTANSRVEQVVEVLDDKRLKDSRLVSIIKSLNPPKKPSVESRIMVFVLYKREVANVENNLRRQGYTVSPLHGDMTQNARLESLDNFKKGATGFLVATDVAARGLDIPDVAAVVNYSFPLTIEDYIHRIGRTGRGGKSGKSITFFTGDDHERSLAGELARVLRDSGFECEGLKKFPMTIKKKQHGAYGAFFRDDVPTTERKKIVFD